MDNRAIAEGLQEAAALLELLAQDAARARAYERAARLVAQLGRPVEAILRSESARIPGIDPETQREIAQWARSGRWELLERLREAVPPGVRELLRLKGLGPRRAGLLWRGLGVESIEDLEQACRLGRLRALEGFGPTLEAKLAEAAAQYRRYRTQRRLADALAEAEPLLRALRMLPGVARAELTGALRRHCPVVSAYEFLLVTARLEVVRERLPDLQWTFRGPDLLEGRTEAAFRSAVGGRIFGASARAGFRPPALRSTSKSFRLEVRFRRPSRKRPFTPPWGFRMWLRPCARGGERSRAPRKGGWDALCRSAT